jgi:hypothetical protein
MRTLVPAITTATALLAGCGGSPTPTPSPPSMGGQPEVTLNTADETMHKIRKGQVRWLRKGDIRMQNRFIDQVFGLAA